jgi:hypothetical protein
VQNLNNGTRNNSTGIAELRDIGDGTPGYKVMTSPTGSKATIGTRNDTAEMTTACDA